MTLNKITKKRKHSQAIINSMKAMRDIGMTYRAIGKHFSLSGGTIYKLLQRWANMYEPAKEIPSQDMVTIQEYAYHHNMSYSGVYHHIKSGSIKTMKYNRILYINIFDGLPNHKFIPEEKINEIQAYAVLGLSNIQISRATGVHRYTVAYYKKEMTCL